LAQITNVFGLNKYRILVIPEVRSSVRKIMGHYTAEEIYSTKRQDVENEIIKETQHNLENNHIHMTALLIRSIQIPENLRKAIEDKLTKQQEALAYEFIVEKEMKEKNVK
jgi:regulator of protease activity HflC (stomatin/prohibitin superfamily)